MTELAKTFEPGPIEARWYAHWEGQGLFRPERNDADFAARMYDLFIDVWKGVLRDADPGLPEERLDTVTRVTVALLDGLCMQLITYGDEQLILRELDTATAMLSASLGS